MSIHESLCRLHNTFSELQSEHSFTASTTPAGLGLEAASDGQKHV